MHWVKSIRIRIFSGPFFPAIAPNTETCRDAEQISVFSPNMGKYKPENLRIRTLFTQ